MKILEYPKIGDIGCTFGDNFLGKSIRWFQNKQNEGDADISHTFWTIGASGNIIEALNKVEINNVEDYLSKSFNVYIVRIKNEFLTQSKLNKAVSYSYIKYKSVGYGYGKILLQILDTVFSSNKFTGSSFSDFPYCSELIALSLMKKCGFLFFNKELNCFLDPKSVTPSNILNDGFDRKNVFEVYKYILTTDEEKTWKLERIN